jgi:Flp pilus assembly pilin Flp
MHKHIAAVRDLPLQVHTRLSVEARRALERLRDQAGQGTVEYGLLLAVIALGVAGVLFLLRDQLRAFFQNVIDILAGATE